jgi:hypothetical protein
VNAQNEKFLAHIIRDFATKVDAKYRRGNREHGNNIMAINALEALKEECLDAYVYLCVLERQLKRRAQNKKKRMK